MSYPKLSKSDQSRWRYENRIERVVMGRELQIIADIVTSGGGSASSPSVIAYTYKERRIMPLEK
jgi:hypothetical protein